MKVSVLGAGACGELRARICAAAWVAGEPLHVLSVPADLQRMLDVERLVVNGIPIASAIERVCR